MPSFHRRKPKPLMRRGDMLRAMAAASPAATNALGEVRRGGEGRAARRHGAQIVARRWRSSIHSADEARSFCNCTRAAEVLADSDVEGVTMDAHRTNRPIPGSLDLVMKEGKMRL